jgi:hypothetical protein
LVVLAPVADIAFADSQALLGSFTDTLASAGVFIIKPHARIALWISIGLVVVTPFDITFADLQALIGSVMGSLASAGVFIIEPLAQIAVRISVGLD